MDLHTEVQVREAAMAYLSFRSEHGAGVYTRDDRFELDGQSIRLMNPQTGIWKPAGWHGALSISTVYTSPTAKRPYDDVECGPDGLGRYKWRGTDPNHADNRALRTAMKHRLPLIWFLGISSGRYAAHYPVYLEIEEPVQHQFVVAVDAIQHFSTLDGHFPTDRIEVAYAYRETKQRLHQTRFRAAVLDAYACKCAVCRFSHAPLLDAAHIVSDSAGGPPLVTNGLSLCRMHHGAYDSNTIGITPNMIVQVNPEILREQDGPMLLHGIQGFHGQRLMVLPEKKSLWPNREALQSRYETFLSAT